MTRVEIYLTPWCPYCRRALALLHELGVTPTVLDVEKEPAREAEMERRAGRDTVPQIFIDGRHVGGCDELHALHARGGLLPLLRPA